MQYDCWLVGLVVPRTANHFRDAAGSIGTVVSVCRRRHCLELSSLRCSGLSLSSARTLPTFPHEYCSVGRQPHSLRYRQNSLCSGVQCHGTIFSCVVRVVWHSATQQIIGHSWGSYFISYFMVCSQLALCVAVKFLLLFCMRPCTSCSCSNQSHKSVSFMIQSVETSFIQFYKLRVLEYQRALVTSPSL